MTSSNAPKNITVSDLANEVCGLLIDKGVVAEAIEAYRLAMCLAISLDLPTDPAPKMTNNKWDTAAVFQIRGQDLDSLMQLMGYQEDSVVTTGKLLAEAGLLYLKAKIDSGSDVFSILVNQGLIKSKA
jgi:hypothetical protein